MSLRRFPEKSYPLHTGRDFTSVYSFIEKGTRVPYTKGAGCFEMSERARERVHYNLNGRLADFIQ